MHQLGPQRDALLCADGGQHQRALRDARHPGEQEDGGFQGVEEDARPREEEVACATQSRMLGLGHRTLGSGLGLKPFAEDVCTYLGLRAQGSRTGALS